jgi:hypothetical protein
VLHDEVSTRKNKKKQEKTFIYNEIPKPDVVGFMPIARAPIIKNWLFRVFCEEVFTTECFMFWRTPREDENE